MLVCECMSRLHQCILSSFHQCILSSWNWCILSNRFIRHNPRVIATRQQQRAPTPAHTCVFARRLILRRRDENHRLLLWSSGWQPHPFQSVGQQLCKWCFLFWPWKMCEDLRRLSIYSIYYYLAWINLSSCVATKWQQQIEAIKWCQIFIRMYFPYFSQNKIDLWNT